MMFILIPVACVLFIIIYVNVLIAGKVDPNLGYTPSAAPADAVQRLARAIKIPTVSHYDPAEDDSGKFREFQQFLADTFPDFHKTAGRTILGDYSVIYKWKGRNDEYSTNAPPVLVTAHYDVVPVDESKWTHKPFGAEIDGEFLWGRGTLDTKNTLMASLEAAEELCRNGFVPERTVYFAFGGDEETTGRNGACRNAEWFSSNGIMFDWLWDEGAITADGLMPGMLKKLSLIGTAEKGQVNILLQADSTAGGHAAMPPKYTATGRIARAVARIEAHPFPLRWLKTTRIFFKKMARAGIPAYKIALSNLWITGGLIKMIMGMNPASAALLRTTTAPTMISGSRKENVLADHASAVINVRILPGDSVEGVLERIRKVVADKNVKVSIKNNNDADNPVAESSIESEGYKLLEQMLNEVIPDSVVLPYLATTASDSRNYASCCRNLYRYSPMILTQPELDRIHGADERISIENYGLAIRCYKTLFKKL